MGNIKRTICPRCGTRHIIQKIGVWHCTECRELFGLPTYNYERQTTAIEFVKIDLTTNTCEYCGLKLLDGQAYVLTGFSPCEQPPTGWWELSGYPVTNTFKISSNQYEKYLHKLYGCYILNWQDEYLNNHVQGGYDWILRISLRNETIEKFGSREYPPHWRKFSQVLKSLSKYTV